MAVRIRRLGVDQRPDAGWNSPACRRSDGAGQNHRRRSIYRSPGTARNSARSPGDLHLYFEDVYSLPGPERIAWARRAEAAALEADPRITNSNGGSFDAIHRPQGAGQLARICGRLSHQLCRSLGRAAGRGRERPDAARQLVVGRAAHRRPRIPRSHRQRGGPAHHTPAGRPAHAHAAGSDRVRAGSGAFADRFGV